MRICLDVSPAVHRKAGLGRYAQELTASLLRVDVTNTYTVFYNEPQTAEVVAPLDALSHLTLDLPTKPWRMSVLLSHLAHRSQDRLAPGVDIFHATDNLLPYFARVRTVFTLHDLVFRFHPATHKPLNRWFLTLGMPFFLRRADAIIAVSEWTRRDAVRLYGIPEDKISVIYEGVDPRFRRQVAEQIAATRRCYGLPERYILYVGTIEPRKNLIALLEAYALLRSQHAVADSCRLVFVGKKGWLYEPFFRRLRELALTDQVIITGFVPDDDLPALYAGADVFVFPSIYEGFGLPVLEAMACGTPVVCSNASSLPEVAGEAALMVDAGDVAGLASAIRRVIEDHDLRASLSARGVVQAQRFTWEETARRTLTVYEKVYGWT